MQPLKTVWLPLLSVRPAVTCGASPPIGWYRIMLLGDRGTCVCKQLAQGCTHHHGRRDSNVRPVDRKSGTLTTRPLRRQKGRRKPSLPDDKVSADDVVYVVRHTKSGDSRQFLLQQLLCNAKHTRTYTHTHTPQ